MTITMKKIASNFNVSVSTVSRVLNNVDKGRVSPPLRERILDFAGANNYQFNYAARALKKKRAGSIALLSSYHPYLLTSYTSEILRGVVDAANEKNFNLIFDVIPESSSFARRYKYLAGSGMTAGIIVQGSVVEENLNFFSSLPENTPMVAVNSRAGEKFFPYCDCDNFGGAFKAAGHLIGLGHRKILHIAGRRGSTNSSERIAGYRAALERYNIKFNSSLILHADFLEEKAFRLLKKLIAEKKLFFDAIFASSDTMAIGAMSALDSFNLKVPEDVSVIGFDDIPLASRMRPRLSTVKHNMYEIGRGAVKMLVQIMNSPSEQVSSSISGTGLVLRDSTARPARL